MEVVMIEKIKQLVFTLALLATPVALCMEWPAPIYLDEQEDTPWTTPLHDAVRAGNIELVNHHLTPLPLAPDWVAQPDVDTRDGHDQTPLHVAANEGHDGIMQLLLYHGATIDARDMFRATPLHVAALRGHHDVAHRLIGTGAAVNAQDWQDYTPLHNAARQGAGCLHTLTLLLQHGANTEARDMHEMTPLGHAWHPDQVALLTARGADTEDRDKHGFTALHAAVRWKMPEVVRALLEAGASMEDDTAWHEVTPRRYTRPIRQKRSTRTNNPPKRQRTRR